jgi:hypothetical protein
MLSLNSAGGVRGRLGSPYWLLSVVDSAEEILVSFFVEISCQFRIFPNREGCLFFHFDRPDTTYQDIAPRPSSPLIRMSQLNLLPCI